MDQQQNEWRLSFARQLFQKIKPMNELAAVFVGGSVARGTADEFSDLELSFVWESEPKDELRKQIICDLSGTSFTTWQRWSSNGRAVEDNIYVSGFQVDIWHNTIANDVADLDATLIHLDSNHNRLNFLDVVRKSVSLYDPEGHLVQWKIRAKEYPEALKLKIIEENIKFFTNGNADIHLHRGDLTILYGLISGLQKRIFNVLLALNHEYYPSYKRMDLNLRQMPIRPSGIEDLINETFLFPPASAWRTTESLLFETLDLVELHCKNVDTKVARQQLESRRKRQASPPELKKAAYDVE